MTVIMIIIINNTIMMMIQWKTDATSHAGETRIHTRAKRVAALHVFAEGNTLLCRVFIRAVLVDEVHGHIQRILHVPGKPKIRIPHKWQNACAVPVRVCPHMAPPCSVPYKRPQQPQLAKYSTSRKPKTRIPHAWQNDCRFGSVSVHAWLRHVRYPTNIYNIVTMHTIHLVRVVAMKKKYPAGHPQQRNPCRYRHGSTMFGTLHTSTTISPSQNAINMKHVALPSSVPYKQSQHSDPLKTLCCARPSALNCLRCTLQTCLTCHNAIHLDTLIRHITACLSSDDRIIPTPICSHGVHTSKTNTALPIGVLSDHSHLTPSEFAKRMESLQTSLSVHHC